MWSSRLAIAALLMLGALSSAAPPARDACAGARFPETGYCVAGAFLAYW